MEELIEFAPQNAIERKMEDAKTGACTNDELVAALRDASIYVGSATAMLPDGSDFSPLLLKAGSDTVVAAFSSRLRLGLYPEHARHAFEMRWRDFIFSLPSGKGAVLNPGYTHQMVIPAEEVRKLKAWLGFPQLRESSGAAS
ncbi:MAG TPA: SseB family protein [Allosphingosinicella sp.]|nr:SseB family protein [Allosphingosinicella sp.]